MESHIEEFQNGGKKESDLVVVIGGVSKSGKSTLAEQAAEALGVEHFSAGDFFRDIADERGMTVEELSKKADRETDLEVDRRTLEVGLEQDCVIDGRIAAWVLGGYADLTVYLTADLEERSRRLSELEDVSQEEAEERIRERDSDNRDRYERYYGVDTTETGIYDVVIDNTDLNIPDQEELVREILEERFPGRLED